MANSAVPITAGTGTSIDTRTTTTDGDHRQVVVLGDPATDAGVAPVDSARGLTVSPLGYQVTCSTDITRPADVLVYAVNDAISSSTTVPTAGGSTLTGAARASGKSGIITDIIVASSNVPATLLQGEIFVFDTAVTAINDNVVFAVSDAEIKTLVARIAFTLDAVGNNSIAHVQGLSIGFTCVGSADLRFLLRAKNGYTPANAEVITVRVKILQTD